MNLVLIGYRGTGKTVISQMLEAELGMPCVGLDAEIVKRAGKPIPEIVAESGWDHFRDIESEVVRDASSRDGWILDTGGGAILREENRTQLQAAGVVFWLQANVQDIVRRIGGDDQRPSLTGSKSFTDEVEEVLTERTPLYQATADVVIDTSSLSVEQAVERIVQEYRQRTR